LLILVLFVVEIVALGQCFSKHFSFPLSIMIPPIPDTYALDKFAAAV
jgi:hypothetical protein